MLRVDSLAAGYGQAQVLFDISLSVDAGQVVTLMGRNGMGKTTTVRAIMGMLPALGGRVLAGRVGWQGASLLGQPAQVIARQGLGLVPEGRQVFPTLTVLENLTATARTSAGGLGPWTLPRVLALFPRLGERAGNLGARLSGGEQQMLAIGRALLTNPSLLILDEATEGLAPLVRAEIWAVLARLKAEGLAILLIDKNLGAVMRLSDHLVIVEKGRSVWSGAPEALAAAPEVSQTYLHV
jgi:branched-chain amino acid transport system ATP-binding protein